MPGSLPIAVQLYSVREDCARDLPGTLKEIARMGYDGVEFAGYHNRSAKELRKLLDDLGLKSEGTHTGIDTLQPEKINQTIDIALTLGHRFLIVPWLGEEYRGSHDAWVKTADFFNDVADKLAAHGLFTGYHNHDFEFTKIGNEYPWDIFFSHTKPQVIMQLDTGNARHAGVDVTPFLSRYPGRAWSVHLKEFSATNGKALIGEGDVRWKEIFQLCQSTGQTQWYVVEQESYAFAPLVCIEKCLQNLRGMKR